ncbi:TrbM/KikA/MpfK family conjugal transfer protein [Massilia pseudoviolaceinigra]|uniref:TrbM/KikA/MpfK family conjugal transfer protein n=1 Tax=Massilia pseudoviolaceinigra TaxID=3057165 RepID=UPI0027964085|nr:TrbM/KikA/MpfK family conjugal transfer protein [Massilia sp. CCM 9206]MDQ1922669.1 TrbM/KikA/MpfK family conjugal transfer protein [Massilia sp. CCM 9206]
MKYKNVYASLAFAVAGFASVAPAQAQPLELTGDTKVACEVILCLSMPRDRPHECLDPLKQYFSIKMKKLHKTLKARADFLKLCPKGEDDSDKMAEQSSTDLSPDPVEVPALPPSVPGAASGIVYTPDMKDALKAEIARVTQIWQEHGVHSKAAYTVVEQCVAATGRVQDGFCKTEMADFELKRAPTAALRDEVDRLTAILATM